MLVKYKITKEYAGQNLSCIIPRFGHVALDADNLTDEMAEASKGAGSPFFEDALESPKATAKTLPPVQS